MKRRSPQRSAERLKHRFYAKEFFIAQNPQSTDPHTEYTTWAKSVQEWLIARAAPYSYAVTGPFVFIDDTTTAVEFSERFL